MYNTVQRLLRGQNFNSNQDTIGVVPPRNDILELPKLTQMNSIMPYIERRGLTLLKPPFF